MSTKKVAVFTVMTANDLATDQRLEEASVMLKRVNETMKQLGISADDVISITHMAAFHDRQIQVWYRK